MTLGAYPALSLADARRRARIVMGDVADGDDPAQAKIERRQVKTFTDLAREYVDMAEKRHKRWTEEKRIIYKDLTPVLGHRLLTDIRRRDVRDLVEDIANKRDAPAMANRTLGMLSRMFNYAVDREWLESSPAARITEPGVEQSRDRVLNDDEIRELWKVLEVLATNDNGEPVEVSTPNGPKRIRRVITPATTQAFQVQLLTAQRPGEVRDMKWAHVDLDMGWWTLPPQATKNGKAHRHGGAVCRRGVKRGVTTKRGATPLFSRAHDPVVALGSRSSFGCDVSCREIQGQAEERADDR